MYASLPVWVLPAFDPLMSDPFQYTRVSSKRPRVSIKYNLQTFTSGGGEGADYGVQYTTETNRM